MTNYYSKYLKYKKKYLMAKSNMWGGFKLASPTPPPLAGDGRAGGFGAP